MIEVEIKLPLFRRSITERALTDCGFKAGNLVKESDFYFTAGSAAIQPLFVKNATKSRPIRRISGNRSLLYFNRQSQPAKKPRIAVALWQILL